MGNSADSGEQLVDASALSLDEWLRILLGPQTGQRLSVTWEFPTDEHRVEYISTIQTRPVEEVYGLLYRFLMKSGSLGIDEINLRSLIAARRDSPELSGGMLRMQYFRRLVRRAKGNTDIQPWEGITWVLDLLPHFPQQALDAVDSYALAHAQILPDERLRGLYEAAELIRAKFIGVPETVQDRLLLLRGVDPRTFEHLVERLYDSMGYYTTLTPPQKDGGRDVVAKREEPGRKECILVECKRYSERIGVQIPRALLGVVSDAKATKGVVLSTTDYTRGARNLAARNPRLELVTGGEAVVLMNKHLGAEWSLRIERLENESRLEQQRRGDG